PAGVAMSTPTRARTAGEPIPPTAAGRPARARGRRALSDRRFAAVMMAPAALFLAAFVAWPLIRLVLDSLYDISPFAGGPRTFTGLGRRSTVFRTVFMYPLMIAPVVAGLLWRFLLIDNVGIVNQILAGLHIIGSPDDISWLSDPDIVLFSVAIPDIWLTTS